MGRMGQKGSTPRPSIYSTSGLFFAARMKPETRCELSSRGAEATALRTKPEGLTAPQIHMQVSLGGLSKLRKSVQARSRAPSTTYHTRAPGC